MVAQGGIIYMDDDPDAPVELTGAQKQALLNAEAAWKNQIKTIVSGW